MVSVTSCARERPEVSPTGPVELTVRPRRRSRRWIRRSAGAVVTVGVLAVALPAAFGLSQHTVADDAMTGSLGRGSAVFSKSLPVADLQVGDVITYPHPSDPDRLLTRRIAAIEAGVVRTRADSTGDLDPWTLTLDQATQARAVVVMPYAGYAYDALDGGSRLLSWAVSRLD